MADVTKEQKARIWEDVRKEFPEDEVMQQVHYVRQLHQLQTSTMEPVELLRFYGGAREKTSA